LKGSKQAANNKVNYVFLFLAHALVFAQNSQLLQQMIETCKHLVCGLFAALQTIPRIWRFRMKRLLESHQTLFPHPKPHPKHRKKWSGSGHETIRAVAQVNMCMAAWAVRPGLIVVLVDVKF